MSIIQDAGACASLPLIQFLNPFDFGLGLGLTVTDCGLALFHLSTTSVLTLAELSELSSDTLDESEMRSGACSEGGVDVIGAGGAEARV